MNRFTLFITKRYLRSINAKFIGVVEVPLPNNVEVEVVSFSSKEDYRLGQATPTRAIIVHERCFNNKELLQYVVAHEYGHHKSWYSYLVFPIVVFLWPWGFFTLLSGLFTFSIGAILFGSLLILVGCAYSWFIEYKAESIAIGILGVNQVISVREQIENMPRPPLLWCIISRMTHLPFSWNLAIYKYFHKDNQNIICH